MASCRESTNRISIECVDNADGFPGVVVYDDKTFPISSQQTGSLNVAIHINVLQQGTAFVAGHGTQSVQPFLTSTVRTYQSPESEDKETGMEWDPPETKSDPYASYNNVEDRRPDSIKLSSGAPPVSLTNDEEGPMEVD